MNRPRRVVKRVADATVRDAGKLRPVVVSLFPDGTIGLRLLRTRKTVYVDAASVYRDAIVWEATLKRMAKKKAKKGAHA